MRRRAPSGKIGAWHRARTPSRPRGARERPKDVAARRPAPLRRAVVVSLLLLSVAAGGAIAEAGQSQPVPQQPLQPGQPARASSTPPSPDIDLFSIDRIRSGLERQPAVRFSKADVKLPVYRMLIEGHEFHLPTWKDNFQVGVPEPPGGADFARMQWLATGPQAWGSPTPFGDSWPAVGHGPGPSERLGALINKIVGARANGRVARARAEVQQELAALAVHNARVAAGLTDDGSDTKKTADKKKRPRPSS